MRHVRNLMVFVPVSGLCVLAFWLMDTMIPVGWRFALFSGFYLVMSLATIKLYKGSERLDPFAPILPSFVLLYLYSAASALNATQIGMTIYGDTVDSRTMETFYICCLIGLAGLGAGFMLGKGTRFGLRFSSQIRERLSDKRTFSKLLWAAPLLGLICFPWVRTAFDFLNVRSYGMTALAGRVAKMQMGAGEPLAEVFLCDIPAALLLMLGILLYFRSRRLIARLAGGGIVLAYGATALLGGQRSALATLGTLILVFVNYRVRRISLAMLAAVFVLGFLMTGVVSLVRSTSNPAKMLSILTSSVASGNTSFLALENNGEFLTGENLMRLISGLRDGETSYTYGSSVITELLVFIPRALYPGRPLPLSQRFVDVFYPGVSKEGGGYGFFYLMEGYWALGLPGIAVFMIVYACLVEWAYRCLTARATTDGMAMWYGFVVYALVFQAVRSGIVGVFKDALMVSLPLVLLYALPRLRLQGSAAPQPSHAS